MNVEWIFIKMHVRGVHRRTHSIFLSIKFVGAFVITETKKSFVCCFRIVHLREPNEHRSIFCWLHRTKQKVKLNSMSAFSFKIKTDYWFFVCALLLLRDRIVVECCVWVCLCRCNVSVRDVYIPPETRSSRGGHMRRVLTKHNEYAFRWVSTKERQNETKKKHCVIQFLIVFRRISIQSWLTKRGDTRQRNDTHTHTPTISFCNKDDGVDDDDDRFKIVGKMLVAAVSVAMAAKDLCQCACVYVSLNLCKIACWVGEIEIFYPPTCSPYSLMHICVVFLIANVSSKQNEANADGEKKFVHGKILCVGLSIIIIIIKRTNSTRKYLFSLDKKSSMSFCNTQNQNKNERKINFWT